MEFSRGTKADHRACLAIVAASPEHFHASALPTIQMDIEAGALYVVRESGSVLAFAVVRQCRPQVAEILWMAVDRGRRAQGIGTELLCRLAAELGAAGTSLLVAKSLAPTSPDSPYVATRRFYDRAGFLLVDIVDPYPGWNPGNPCALYAKPLAATQAWVATRAPQPPDSAVAQGQVQRVMVSPPTSEADRRWLTAFWLAQWGSDSMVTRGTMHRLPDGMSLIARGETGNVGAATYVLDPEDGSCELLSLNAAARGRGVGSALLAAAEESARKRGSRKIWMVTSNDNLDALRFYQRRGYRLVTVHAGAIDDARRLKPSIPAIGNHGIPLHDEIELGKRL